MFDKLEKLAPREKWGLGLAALFLLVLITDRLVVQTVANRFQDLRIEEQNLTDQLAFASQVAAQKPAVQKAYEDVSGVLATARSDAETIDEMKGMLDLLAGESGLLLVSMKHLEPRPAGTLREFIVDIGEFEGSMQAVMTFLHRVSQAPGLLRIARLTVSPAPRSDQPLKGSVLISKVMVAEE